MTEATHTRVNDSEYYVSDLITIQAEDTVFRVPSDMFRTCEYFRDILDKSSASDDEWSISPLPAVIPDAKASAMRAILGLLSSGDAAVDSTIATMEQDVILDCLRLAQTLKCAALVAKLERPSKGYLESLAPLECLEVATKYDLSEWKLHAYTQLCDRTDPLTADEGEKVGFRVFAVLARIREQSIRAGSKKGRTKKVPVKEAVRQAASELGVGLSSESISSVIDVAPSPMCPSVRPPLGAAVRWEGGKPPTVPSISTGWSWASVSG